MAQVQQRGTQLEAVGSEGGVRKRYTQKGLLRVCVPSRGPHELEFLLTGLRPG